MFFVVLTILTGLVLFVCVLIQKIVDKQHNAIMEKHHEAYEAEKKQKENERQKELENAKILEFYDQCVKENVFDLNTDKSNQKAILIHNRLGLTTNYTDAFSIGKSMREDKKVEAREALLLELRVKENRDYQQSVKYSSCIGRDKEISMLNDLIAPYRAKLAEIAYEQNNATDSYVKGPTLESKASPTIVGGAVSALAGGTAGVIAAINTKQENKQITNRNVEAIEANHQSFIIRTTLLADKKSKNRQGTETFRGKIRKSKD